MAEPELEKHGMGILEEYAGHLNSIDSSDPNARAFYEAMSGAIVCSDETVRTTPTEVVLALRQLWPYRTYLMLNGVAKLASMPAVCRVIC